MDGVVLYYAVITTKSDSTDSTVREERYMKLTKQKFEEDDYEFFCHICSAHVLENSKHCGRCQRCSAGFDHHCIWLNNCIGKSNYPIFLKLIISVLLNSTLSIFTSSFVFHYNEDLSSQAWQNTVIIMNIVINTLSFLFVGYLLAYHIWLIKNKLSTY